MLASTNVITSFVSGSPQRWFGSATALLPPSPATIWSRGSNDARVRRLCSRASPVSVTWPEPAARPHDPPASNSPPSVKPMSSPSMQLRPLGVQRLPANDPVESPSFDVTVGLDTPLFRTILITPAIASDPYCADA